MIPYTGYAIPALLVWFLLLKRVGHLFEKL
jgi:hypothetical protein